MREISTFLITETVRTLCLKNAFVLPDTVKMDLNRAKKIESSPQGRKVIDEILTNAEIASKEMIPLCQDTGLVQVYLEVGQDLCLEGPLLTHAVNNGVKKAYSDGYLRKSSCLPLTRKNLNDNCPASLETKIVHGAELHITVLSKGGGCDNTSRLFMLKPAEGWEGICRVVLEAVKEAGAAACPPFYIGVGVGGTFESVGKVARQALFDAIKVRPFKSDDDQKAMRLLSAVNDLGLGPMGLGGRITALGLRLLTVPCHIASLPVAVNINCHSFRLSKAVL